MGMVLYFDVFNIEDLSPNEPGNTLNPHFSQACYCDVTMARTTRLFLCRATQRSETTPALPSVGKALYYAPLSRLATKPREKCGLTLKEVDPRYVRKMFVNSENLVAILFSAASNNDIG